MWSSLAPAGRYPRRRARSRPAVRLPGFGTGRRPWPRGSPDGQLAVLRPVGGRTGADLRRRLVERELEHFRRRELGLVRPARVARAPGHRVLDERVQRRALLVLVLDQPRLAEHDDRAVVERVMEGSAREHEAVEQRHGHAHGHTLAQRAEHAAERRAVQIQLLSCARVQHRDHERLAAVGEAEVRDESLVEDRMDRRVVVRAAARAPAHACASAGCRCLVAVLVHVPVYCYST